MLFELMIDLIYDTMCNQQEETAGQSHDIFFK